jgi:hypothetical protein
VSSTELSVDVDVLDSVPAKTMLRLIEQAQKARKYAALFQSTVQRLAPLFRQFEVLDVDLEFSLRNGDIDLIFTGDAQRLRQVWAELRRNGYNTESRPKRGDITFHAYWDQEGFSRIWMMFSSSVCKRVQVGTRMVEQPIYETRCGEELPALEEQSGETVPVVAAAPNASAGDIPF